MLLAKTRDKQLNRHLLFLEDNPVAHHSLHSLAPIQAREVIRRRHQDSGSHRNQDKWAPALVELSHRIHRALQDLVHRLDLASISRRLDPYLEVNRQAPDLEEALEPQRRNQDKEQASSAAAGNKQLQVQEASGSPNQQEEGSLEAKAPAVRQQELVSSAHPAVSWAQAQPLVSSRVLHSQVQPLEGCSVELQLAPLAVSSGSLHSHTISPLDKLLAHSQQLLCLVEAKEQELPVLVVYLGQTPHKQRLVAGSLAALVQQLQVAPAAASLEQNQLELLAVVHLELKRRVVVSSATQVPSQLVQAHSVSSQPRHSQEASLAALLNPLAVVSLVAARQQD